MLVVLALAAGYRAFMQDVDPITAPIPAAAPSSAAEAPGSLYGRITTGDGATYEGWLRWGGDEEAFWGNYFNGHKDENPWAVHTPIEKLNEERSPVEILGFEISLGERPIDLGRPFMARFGDIVRIEAHGDGVRGVLDNRIAYDPDVRVTLKSGTTFDLDRLSAGDFDDGVRVWDARRGVVDLGPRQIRSIEFLHNEQPGAAPARLHGTVRTRQGDFTGFLQWDREEAAGRDVLVGKTAEGARSVRFDSIRAIARHASDGALVTLLDGREILLTGTRKVGPGHRGIYVDDRRYGRVLVSWGAVERVDFSPGGAGPSYGDFPTGHPLRGQVTTRAGRRLAGRLVYDLDESETTETLDAPSRGVDYTIPFGLVASIALIDAGEEADEPATVTLHNGETLHLERRGDLGDGNAGMLIFGEGQEHPEYVPWADVAQIDLDRPPAMYPPVDER